MSAATDLWKAWDDFRAAKIQEADLRELEQCISCSYGTCNEMGTASTMATLSEALGMMPSGTSGIPANHSRRRVAAEGVGRRIVEMVGENLRPSQIMTEDAFHNAICVLNAIGGSTNAVIHLVAIAGRLGITLPLSLFDEISQATPMIVNLKPSGRFLMEHLHRAGGLPAVMREIADLLHQDCLTVSGKAQREHIKTAQCFDRNVIGSLNKPIYPSGALVVLKGNLVPSGAILKASAATERLLNHTGPAVVFDGYQEMLARIDSEELDVSPDSVLVMRNTGPRGVPGMPEWAEIPIPVKLLKQGVRDVVRISDSQDERYQLSGRWFFTRRRSPRSAGPLAVVRDGDKIRLSVAERRLDLLISDQEMADRLVPLVSASERTFAGLSRGFTLITSFRRIKAATLTFSAQHPRKLCASSRRSLAEHNVISNDPVSARPGAKVEEFKKY